MGEAVCPAYINATHDRVDPGGAGKRMDNTGCAQNGNAADNAKSRVPGCLGDFFTAGNDMVISKSGDTPADVHSSFDHFAHHRAGNRIDGRFTNSNRQAGFGDHANTFAAVEGDARPPASALVLRWQLSSRHGSHQDHRRHP